MSTATPSGRLEAPEHLTRFLVGRDEDCPGCSYNLRDLTRDSCPECGMRLVLQVSLTDRNMGAFIAGVIGLCTGTGFCLVLTVFVIWRFFFLSALLRPKRADVWPALLGVWPVFVVMLVMSAALVWWLRSRNTIRKWSRAARWSIAGATYVLSAACVVFLILMD